MALELPRVPANSATPDAIRQAYAGRAIVRVFEAPGAPYVELDDTWTDEEGRYAGKGKLAAPLLLENGFSVVAKTRRTLALRRAISGI